MEMRPMFVMGCLLPQFFLKYINTATVYCLIVKVIPVHNGFTEKNLPKLYIILKILKWRIPKCRKPNLSKACFTLLLWWMVTHIW